MSNMNQCKI